MAGKLAPHVELPRRFYEAVSTRQGADGATVLLDGRPVKTPSGKTLTTPSPQLADRLAREWDDQTTHIDMVAMRGRSTYGLSCCSVSRSMALRAMVTAESPTRSRFCEIFIAAVVRRRSVATGAFARR